MVVKCSSDADSIEVAAGSILSLNEARGVRLQVVRGCVWITQDPDRRDFVAESGESVVLDERGKAVISAGSATRLRLSSFKYRTRL